MKAIKFRLLFDGHHSELEAQTFEVSAGSNSAQFKIADLLDINNLRESKSQQEFEELVNYFAFPGFSLYYIQSQNTLFVIAYRAVAEKHQIYERGFWKDDGI